MPTKRVLYVDDDLDNSEMLKLWLMAECGCEAVAVSSGAEAIELISSEYFDVFVFDYCLPDITAVGLCEQARELRPDATIIVYSALERDVDKERALAAGADHYLIKPNDLGDLRSLINGYNAEPCVSLNKRHPRTAGAADHHFMRSVSARSRFRASGIF